MRLTKSMRLLVELELQCLMIFFSSSSVSVSGSGVKIDESSIRLILAVVSMALANPFSVKNVRPV